MRKIFTNPKKTQADLTMLLHTNTEKDPFCMTYKLIKMLMFAERQCFHKYKRNNFFMSNQA